MFRHVVMFRWTDAATKAELDHLAAGLDELPDRVPGISRYTHGPDAGLNDGNFQYVIVAEFASAAEYLVYRDDPWHQELIAERVRPVMAERSAVQYEVPG